MACGKRTDQSQTLMEVITLHMRGLGGDQRAQALGEMVEAALCDACLDAHVAGIIHPVKARRRTLLVSAGLMAAGAALAAVPWGGEVQLGLFGFAALGLGALGLYFGLDRLRKASLRAASAGPQERRRLYAMEALGPHLPGKAGDNELSYVPFIRALTDVRLGDLMAQYQLLPQIAEQLRDKAKERFSQADENLDRAQPVTVD